MPSLLWIILIIVLICALGGWGRSGWSGAGAYYGGPYLGGGLGLVLLIVLIVFFMRGGF